VTREHSVQSNLFRIYENEEKTPFKRKRIFSCCIMTILNHFLGRLKLSIEGLMVVGSPYLRVGRTCVMCRARQCCKGLYYALGVEGQAWGPRHNALLAMRYSTYHQPRHNAWDAGPSNWICEVAFQRYASTPRNLHEISSTRLEWEIVVVRASSPVLLSMWSCTVKVDEA